LQKAGWYRLSFQNLIRIENTDSMGITCRASSTLATMVEAPVQLMSLMKFWLKIRTGSGFNILVLRL
jgi:hypothetical protein